MADVHSHHDENQEPSSDQGSLKESVTSSYAEGDLTSCASHSTFTGSHASSRESDALTEDDMQGSDWEIPDLDDDDDDDDDDDGQFDLDDEDIMADRPASPEEEAGSEDGEAKQADLDHLSPTLTTNADSSVPTQDPSSASTSVGRPRLVVALAPSTKRWVTAVGRKLAEGRRQIAKSVDYTFTVKVKPTLSHLGDDVGSAFTKVRLRLSATSSKLSLAFRRFKDPELSETDLEAGQESDPTTAEVYTPTAALTEGSAVATAPDGSGGVNSGSTHSLTASERRKKKMELVRSGLAAWWKKTRAEIKAAMRPPPPPPTTTTTSTTSTAPAIPPRTHPIHLQADVDVEAGHIHEVGSPVDNMSPSTTSNASLDSAYTGSTQELDDRDETEEEDSTSPGVLTASALSSPYFSESDDDASDSEDYDVDVEEILDDEYDDLDHDLFKESGIEWDESYSPSSPRLVNSNITSSAVDEHVIAEDDDLVNVSSFGDDDDGWELL